MIGVQTNLRPGDRVVLFPSFARCHPEEGTWRVHVRGAVFDPQEIRLRKRMMVRLLRRLLSAEPHQFETELFRQRIETFVAKTEKGRKISVKIGNNHYPLVKGSHRNGRFGGTIWLSDDEMRQCIDGGWGSDTELSITVEGASDNCPDATGRIHLLRDHGWSIVSDIDDTIKHTDVARKRELLANTFLREFRCVDGMAEVYQAVAEKGAQFHYVSSSPWQLYVPLAELCDVSGFPEGTFHLHSFRLRDHVLRRVTLHRGGKAVEIRRLLEAFPQRKFILVGDSGERDPEIYARLAADYPEQVRAVFIRQIDDNPISDERNRKLLTNFPANSMQTFESPRDLLPLCEALIAESE